MFRVDVMERTLSIKESILTRTNKEIHSLKEMIKRSTDDGFKKKKTVVLNDTKKKASTLTNDIALIKRIIKYK